jgi:competence ComEA-like helix-hairpin-helix protein
MFVFTTQERQVILFLLSMALLGIGIDFLSKRYAPVRTIACISCNAGKVNINQADKEALKSIPGIGDKLAQRIIEYRQKKSRIIDPQELSQIKGLNRSRLERLKQSIFVE